tara:strand:- start:140 stop:388 length:249 start_codon:yes stop_codon:yes gene_type:complete
MSKENIVNIGGEEIKESDLTAEQQFHKNHIVSLRNKISKLHFELDDLTPSLKFHEQSLIEVTKKQAEEELSESEDQASAEEQ